MKLIILFMVLFQQDDSLDIKYFYNKAYETYPVVKQNELYKESSDIKIENYDINYLPKITLNGQATYQSAVTELTNSPLKPTPPGKDQYKLYLDIKQLIYDGGLTSALKDAERYDLISNRQKVQVEQYKLKEKINEIYFSILLAQQRIKFLEILKSDVQQKLAQVLSKIEGGLLAINNAYILEAEILKIEGDIIDADNNRKGLIKSLSELTGETLDYNTKFKIPEVVLHEKYPNPIIRERPEIILYNSQKHALQSYQSVINTNTMPKISLFGQGGVGRPGLNFLDNTFQPYYLVGISFNWSPVTWGADKNDLALNLINQRFIENQEEIFNTNLKVSSQKSLSDIEKYKELLEKDNRIIEIREKIIEIASSQLDQGIITSTDYLTELSSENQAKQNKETHKIQLIQSIVNYKTLIGQSF